MHSYEVPRDIIMLLQFYVAKRTLKTLEQNTTVIFKLKKLNAILTIVFLWSFLQTILIFSHAICLNNSFSYYLLSVYNLVICTT